LDSETPTIESLAAPQLRPGRDAEKAGLVPAMNEPGTVVTEVARRKGVDASLLYRWRRQFVAERPELQTHQPFLHL
jgi:transposase-like protein